MTSACCEATTEPSLWQEMVNTSAVPAWDTTENRTVSLPPVNRSKMPPARRESELKVNTTKQSKHHPCGPERAPAEESVAWAQTGLGISSTWARVLKNRKMMILPPDFLLHTKGGGGVEARSGLIYDSHLFFCLPYLFCLHFVNSGLFSNAGSIQSLQTIIV
jgi:hypothetical protein